MPPPPPRATVLKYLPSLTRNQAHFIHVYFSEAERRGRLVAMAKTCWRLVLMMEIDLGIRATHLACKKPDFLAALKSLRKPLHIFYKTEEAHDDDDDDDDDKEDDDDEDKECEVQEPEVVMIYKKIFFLTRLVEWAFENEPAIANKYKDDYHQLKEPWYQCIEEWVDYANFVAFQ